MSTTDTEDDAFARFAYQVDLPMSHERARGVSIGPVAGWCRDNFGALGAGWTFETRGDTIRFCFLSEENADRFAECWSLAR
ncbi:MAG TPA: hypothetical protein VGN05_05650 [Parvibaculum sp.]|jgi:hypothetical protein